MNPLISQLKKLGPISIETENKILQKTKFTTRKKGDFFLKKGQTVSNMFVLETGCIRGFYNKGDKEINTFFGFENELIGSFLPLFSNLPSYENLQFLEDAALYYISANDLNALYSEDMSLIPSAEKWLNITVLFLKNELRPCRFIRRKNVTFYCRKNIRKRCSEFL